MLVLAPLLISLGAVDVEPEDVRPGLVAEYRSVAEPAAKVFRIDVKPAFALGGSSPHPRIPAGPFTATWTGLLSIRDATSLRLSAFVSGDVSVEIDGIAVLNGQGKSLTARTVAKEPLSRPPGYYRIAIRYRSLPDVPARLQLWWEGESFAAESIPAWRFSHIATERGNDAKDGEAQQLGRAEAGRFGCARCHASAFPSVDDPPPGPSLADANKRLSRTWLLEWLADPGKLRPGTHMPAIFTNDRRGFIERWLVAESLGQMEPVRSKPTGDHRAGRLAFLGLGCTACHFVPEIPRADQADLGRRPLVGLGDRLSEADLATFLGNPHGRYPDGRMPRVPVAPDQARNIAAYLLLWSKPTERPNPEPPTPDEIREAVRRLGARDAASAAGVLLKNKGCTACHAGLGETRPMDVAIGNPSRGCMTGEAGPRFALSPDVKAGLSAYLRVAGQERHASPFAARQRKLERAGCVQCHQRDTDRPPPVEEASSKLGGGFLMQLPFQRTPRLSNPHQKYEANHIRATLREGIHPLRGGGYSFRMPAFGAEADELAQALAEGDGDLIGAEAKTAVADPTLGTLHGSPLVGFQGYACVSCHIWNGQRLGSPDPGVTGPDLTRTPGRIRREWFDRFVENPLRYSPGTPMPSIFPHGQPATIAHVLDGHAGRQRDAIWAYLSLGKSAPSPKPPPPLPISAPAPGEPPVVGQIPIRVENKPIESLSLLYGSHDLFIYDLGVGRLHSAFAGGQILRTVEGRIRRFIAAGSPVPVSKDLDYRLGGPASLGRALLGYDRLPDGVRVRWSIRYESASARLDDVLRFDPKSRRMTREVSLVNLPAGVTLEVATKPVAVRDGKASATLTMDLPSAKTPAPWNLVKPPAVELVEGSLTRLGYRAIAYPRPKTVSGEDRVMPGAVAVRPRDGQVFIASMKTGELFALRDPDGTGKNATFENYGHGLFQDALSMLADDDGLYVLHRRNLTKIVESSAGGAADRFDQVAALPQGVADSYDMAYGLARDRVGRFVFTHAPYGNQQMPGAGSVLRMLPSRAPEEIAHGMRNPIGWCSGPNGEIFFTDNQGDWVATNKLCHVVEGRYYGWPNQQKKATHSLPMTRATVWVPYAWAQSINGVAYDHTGGKFGPFAGQVFMAELMFGGAIVRANLEVVNGVYQGACFPFWGKGLLGPVTLAFDRRGPLYVGSITEPGWMAQPDRGALFRIDYTGQVPFEIQSIHIKPRGFGLRFTAPVDRAIAAKGSAYRLEHYRYEYTGAYGSPELDRAAVKVERVIVADDGRSVVLETAPLVRDRVYMISASGVCSAKGESLVHPTGAYTVNEVPK